MTAFPNIAFESLLLRRFIDHIGSRKSSDFETRRAANLADAPPSERMAATPKATPKNTFPAFGDRRADDTVLLKVSQR